MINFFCLLFKRVLNYFFAVDVYSEHYVTQSIIPFVTTLKVVFFEWLGLLSPNDDPSRGCQIPDQGYIVNAKSSQLPAPCLCLVKSGWAWHFRLVFFLLRVFRLYPIVPLLGGGTPPKNVGNKSKNNLEREAFKKYKN